MGTISIIIKYMGQFLGNIVGRILVALLITLGAFIISSIILGSLGFGGESIRGFICLVAFIIGLFIHPNTFFGSSD